jgi:hypothetical protein
MTIILIVRMPNRPSRLKTVSIPSVRRKVRARRSRPASAQGLFGQNTRSGRSCSQRQSIRCRADGDPAALRLAFKDLMGSALLRQYRQQSSVCTTKAPVPVPAENGLGPSMSNVADAMMNTSVGRTQRLAP